ncbi:MAG TPA: hypothetical protein VE398_12955 [Acidobacteriota bacterium]|nr:hypothetical protein [Acidobacteriota bacterium]
MRNAIKLAFSLLVLLVFGLPAFSQGRPGSSGGSDSRGSGAAASSVSSTTSVTSSTPSYSGSRDFSSSRGYGSGGTGFSSGQGRGAAYNPPPKLQGTSFYSVNSYYAWQDFFWYLQSRYMMNGLYFQRFYRNREPLITPAMLKLITREPLRLSMQMVTAVDELEAMLQARQEGKPVSKEDISAKAQEIRELAKRIRSNEALAFAGQRKDKDVLKGDNIENLGLEAVSQLRELVTDLNTQLRSMYTQDTTSTISVNSLSQPSLESLSKGIEKVSKVIENSAKKI